MFPSKRKYKTKVQHVDSPRFNECFKVPRVNPDDVEKMGCRIRFESRGHDPTCNSSFPLDSMALVRFAIGLLGRRFFISPTFSYSNRNNSLVSYSTKKKSTH